MLQPKRTKFRKQHKGRIKGEAKGGSDLTFGTYGLKATEPERVTARQIEAARRAILETELRDNQTSLSESDWATILQSTGSKSGRHLQQLCAQAATTVILEVTDDASEPRAISYLEDDSGCRL